MKENHEEKGVWLSVALTAGARYDNGGTD